MGKKGLQKVLELLVFMVQRNIKRKRREIEAKASQVGEHAACSWPSTKHRLNQLPGDGNWKRGRGKGSRRHIGGGRGIMERSGRATGWRSSNSRNLAE